MLALSSLNTQQRRAVEHIQGPLLVLAGAGSGKTRVITYRIGHLLEKGVAPEKILALTFTNKAANEMRERLISLVGEPAKRCTLSTFHALGVAFLKEEYQSAGLLPKFTILDEADQIDAVKQSLLQLNLDPKKYVPENLHAQITGFKSQLLLPPTNVIYRIPKMVYEHYLRRLKIMNAVDFEDLIRIPVELLEKNQEVRQRWYQKYEYLMVDEYQDTNGAQLRMLKALSGCHNICVVGDDDQSIYGWRGAVAQNILKFDQHFEGAKTIALTQNYRSTNYILKAANEVIQHNPERHAKTLWSAYGDGEKLRYRVLENGDDEATWVAEEIKNLKAQGHAYSDFAILYRTNLQSRTFEDAFRDSMIPYRVIGGQKFYDRKEIRDMIAYLRLIINPYDENALRRIINYPPRNIGDQSIEKLIEYAAQHQKSLFACLGIVDFIPQIAGSTQKSIFSFYQMIQSYQQVATNQSLPWHQILREITQKIDLKQTLIRDEKDAEKGRIRWENVVDLADSLQNIQEKNPQVDLASFLNQISLDGQKEHDNSMSDQVTMMSLHSAKGLEFPHVYFVGFEDQWIPHQKVLEEGGSIEEERRLVYVGITRAQKRLTLTHASKRLSFGKAEPRKVSRFIEEIPEQLFDDAKKGEVISFKKRQDKVNQVLDSLLDRLKMDPPKK
jgi:superfamily I DNA/RNA helicase